MTQQLRETLDVSAGGLIKVGAHGSIDSIGGGIRIAGVPIEDVFATDTSEAAASAAAADASAMAAAASATTAATSATAAAASAAASVARVAAFVDPASATAGEIATALIAAGLMASS